MRRPFAAAAAAVLSLPLAGYGVRRGVRQVIEPSVTARVEAMIPIVEAEAARSRERLRRHPGERRAVIRLVHALLTLREHRAALQWAKGAPAAPAGAGERQMLLLLDYAETLARGEAQQEETRALIHRVLTPPSPLGDEDVRGQVYAYGPGAAAP